MAKMHIADTATAALHDRGLFTGWALCGARLNAKNGAAPGDPYCPKCAKKAGWRMTAQTVRPTAGERR